MTTNEVTEMNNSTTSDTSTSNQHNPDSQNPGADSIVIHCDGAGSRPDGTGSGFAWIQPRTGERHIERVDGLTNNQAEYRALISVLTNIPVGTVVQILTDSQVMWSQVIGTYRVRNPELSKLLSQVHTLIKENNLTINLQWVQRNKNLAGKLL